MMSFLSVLFFRFLSVYLLFYCCLSLTKTQPLWLSTEVTTRSQTVAPTTLEGMYDRYINYVFTFSFASIILFYFLSATFFSLILISYYNESVTIICISINNITTQYQQQHYRIGTIYLSIDFLCLFLSPIFFHLFSLLTFCFIAVYLLLIYARYDYLQK